MTGREISERRKEEKIEKKDVKGRRKRKEVA